MKYPVSQSDATAILQENKYYPIAFTESFNKIGVCNVSCCIALNFNLLKDNEAKLKKSRNRIQARLRNQEMPGVSGNSFLAGGQKHQACGVKI